MKRLLLILSIVMSRVGAVSSMTSSSSTDSGSSTSLLSGRERGLRGVVDDSIEPFVITSPLVLGAVCKDGVLLIAAPADNGERNESVLLQKSWTCDDHDVDDTEVSKLHVPRCYNGPFRICLLDSYCSNSSAMVCCGWREDSRYLVKRIRSICKKEWLVFGCADTDNSGSSLEYGSYLSSEVSSILSKLYVSESIRSLCCVSLIASSSFDRNGNVVSKHSDDGYDDIAGRVNHGLWLVDSTGSYRVRAHAIGSGSHQANNVLRRNDWTTMNCTDAARTILRTLYIKNYFADDNYDVQSGKEKEFNNGGSRVMPKDSVIELGIVGPEYSMQHDSKKTKIKTMKRIFLSDIFQKTKQK